MAYYRDLRAFLDALEHRGKLYRFTSPVDKDRELFPLYRIQLQGLPEAERKVFLFEDVRGARGNRYAMPVVDRRLRGDGGDRCPGDGLRPARGDARALARRAGASDRLP